VRVPEAQRKPIIQQHMPAARGFSYQGGPLRKEWGRQQRPRNHGNALRKHRG
jgi:hypothetical protein